MVSLGDLYSDGEKHELEWQQQLHISVVPVYHTLCVHRNDMVGATYTTLGPDIYTYPGLNHLG